MPRRGGNHGCRSNLLVPITITVNQEKKISQYLPLDWCSRTQGLADSLCHSVASRTALQNHRAQLDPICPIDLITLSKLDFVSHLSNLAKCWKETERPVGDFWEGILSRVGAFFIWIYMDYI